MDLLYRKKEKETACSATLPSNLLDQGYVWKWHSNSNNLLPSIKTVGILGSYSKINYVFVTLSNSSCGQKGQFQI